jgi:hypothetical protein
MSPSSALPSMLSAIIVPLGKSDVTSWRCLLLSRKMQNHGRGLIYMIAVLQALQFPAMDTT